MVKEEMAHTSMEPKVAICAIQWPSHESFKCKSRGIKTIPCVVKHNVTLRNWPHPKRKEKKRKVRVHK
jgi:hypothetical protein